MPLFPLVGSRRNSAYHAFFGPARMLHPSAPCCRSVLIGWRFVELPGITLCSWLALSGFRKRVKYAGYANNCALDKAVENGAILRPMNDELISGLAKRLRNLVPDTARGPARDLEANFRALLEAALGQGDYVTFEEFEAQRKVLQRTRQKVESLQATLAELEKSG